MSILVTGDRSATRAEVLADRKVLRRLAGQYGLGRPSVDVTGTVVVHSEEPGYAAVRGTPRLQPVSWGSGSTSSQMTLRRHRSTPKRCELTG
jgi:hypothetical protein